MNKSNFRLTQLIQSSTSTTHNTNPNLIPTQPAMDQILKMKIYRIHLKHDNGYQNFLISARTYQQAENLIMQMERCPKSAILSIKLYKD